MAGILVDTNVLIDFLRGNESARTFLMENDDAKTMSALTVAELYGGVREGDERTALDQLVAAFNVLPVDVAIAQEGGLFFRQYHKSHGTDIVDALIAATALLNECEIVTLNKKHFPMIPDVWVPYRA